LLAEASNLHPAFFHHIFLVPASQPPIAITAILSWRCSIEKCACLQRRAHKLSQDFDVLCQFEALRGRGLESDQSKELRAEIPKEARSFAAKSLFLNYLSDKSFKYNYLLDFSVVS
jgi:hypothetical protein